jgi:hypothetical protein
MKICTRCKTQNDDDEACCTECGYTTFAAPETPAIPPSNVQPAFPSLSDEDKRKEWVTVLVPHSEFQATFAVGRLRTAGIPVNIHNSKIGEWDGRNVMSFAQVHPHDFEAAKALLNGG